MFANARDALKAEENLTFLLTFSEKVVGIISYLWSLKKCDRYF